MRVVEPELPEDVSWADLDRDVRARLRTLSKDNAQAVGAHLVMAGRLLDLDPEASYEHAQAAVRRGGRVDVVREAAGLAAYRTGRYAEALRELRTVRRLNGSSEHLAIMADCERGLGRPERAVALAQGPEADTLDAVGRVELTIVVSGARLDLGDPDAAIAVLSGIRTTGATLLAARVAVARAEALSAAGRHTEAEEVLAGVPAALLAEAQDEAEPDEDVLLFDLEEDEDVDASEASTGDEGDGGAADEPATVDDLADDADDAGDADGGGAGGGTRAGDEAVAGAAAESEDEA